MNFSEEKLKKAIIPLFKTEGYEHTGIFHE
jgi:hypothetical protein